MRVLPSGRLVRAPHLLIAVLAIHAVAFAIAAAESAQPASDFDRYYEIGSTPGRPYVDYQVEHPDRHAAGASGRSARLPGGRASFGLGIVVLESDRRRDHRRRAALGLGHRRGGVRRRRAGAGAGPLLHPRRCLVDRGGDPRGRGVAAATGRLCWACALAIGAAFKLWPLVLATLLIVPWRERRSIAAASPRSAVTAALLGGLAVWLAGANGDAAGADVSRRHRLADREPGRKPGSPRPTRRRCGWRAARGASARSTALVSIAMFLAAAPICVWSSWRGARLDRVGAGWLASVSALLLLSALLSAQYVIWLAPAAAIAWSEGDTAARRADRDRDPADAGLVERLRRGAPRRAAGAADRRRAQPGAARARRHRHRAPRVSANSEVSTLNSAI